MAIKDYIGRTVDINAIKGQSPSTEKQLVMELALPGDSGEIVTGINKLAQRFFIELMTEPGSLQYLPRRGCVFMQQARRGQWQSTLDVMSAFSASLLDIKDNLLAEETSDMPDDERFADAELVTVSLVGTSASVTIRVRSLAGNSRTFISPLQITV